MNVKKLEELQEKFDFEKYRYQLRYALLNLSYEEVYYWLSLMELTGEQYSHMQFEKLYNEMPLDIDELDYILSLGEKNEMWKAKIKCIRGGHYNANDSIWEFDTWNSASSSFETNAVCPKCGNLLKTSDLAGYSFLCETCDENFMGIEVKDFESKSADLDFVSLWTDFFVKVPISYKKYKKHFGELKRTAIAVGFSNLIYNNSDSCMYFLFQCGEQFISAEEFHYFNIVIGKILDEIKKEKGKSVLLTLSENDINALEKKCNCSIKSEDDLKDCLFEAISTFLEL